MAKTNLQCLCGGLDTTCLEVRHLTATILKYRHLSAFNQTMEEFY